MPHLPCPRSALPALLVVAAASLAPNPAQAMCGAMLPRQPPPDPGAVTATARITNQASKVVMVREGDGTIMTIANDFDGDVVEFGLVVPVPSVVTKQDVKLLEAKVFDELEAATAPVLVEHFDPDPCPREEAKAAPPSAAGAVATADEAGAPAPRASQYGVKVESHFAAGEYDIAVLSGKDSARLIEWLRLFKYDVPREAEAVIRSYLAQRTYFLVAHVDLRKMKREGRAFLRPLQMKLRSPKFVLPIRLGMVNADGPQELVVFALSPQGRVEPTNYRSARLPTDRHLPPYAKERFADVQRAAFDAETKKEEMRVVFQEWSGDAAGALGPRTLADAGVDDARRGAPWWLSRLHFKYDARGFPEDLVLQATADRAPFAVRHHVTQPWRGDRDACPEARTYFARLAERQERGAAALAALTGWPLAQVRSEAGLGAVAPAADEAPAKLPWYRRIWSD